MKKNIYNAKLLKKMSFLKQLNLLKYNKGFVQGKGVIDVEGNEIETFSNYSSSYTYLTSNICREALNRPTRRSSVMFCVNANFNFLGVLHSWSVKQNYKYINQLNKALRLFIYARVYGIKKQMVILYPEKGGFVAYCNGLIGWVTNLDLYYLLIMMNKKAVTVNNTLFYLKFAGVRSIIITSALKIHSGVSELYFVLLDDNKEGGDFFLSKSQKREFQNIGDTDLKLYFTVQNLVSDECFFFKNIFILIKKKNGFS